MYEEENTLQITSIAEAKEVQVELFHHYSLANLPCCTHGVYFNNCPIGCTEPAPDDMESEESQQYSTMLERALEEFRTRYNVSCEEIDNYQEDDDEYSEPPDYDHMQDYEEEDCEYSEPDYDYLQELAEVYAEQEEESKRAKASAIKYMAGKCHLHGSYSLYEEKDKIRCDVCDRPDHYTKREKRSARLTGWYSKRWDSRLKWDDYTMLWKFKFKYPSKSFRGILERLQYQADLVVLSLARRLERARYTTDK